MDGDTTPPLKRVGALALVAVALAMASLIQSGVWNQNLHLALVWAAVDERCAPADRLTRLNGV